MTKNRNRQSLRLRLSPRGCGFTISLNDLDIVTPTKRRYQVTFKQSEQTATVSFGSGPYVANHGDVRQITRDLFHKAQKAGCPAGSYRMEPTDDPCVFTFGWGVAGDLGQQPSATPVLNGLGEEDAYSDEYLSIIRREGVKSPSELIALFNLIRLLRYVFLGLTDAAGRSKWTS